MKFFEPEDSEKQTCEIDPKKFYDEFYTMTCFNCECLNHSKCSMSCGLKNIQISKEGKCIYWSEFNKKKTTLMYKGKVIDDDFIQHISYTHFDKDLIEKYLERMEEEKKSEDNQLNSDSPFAQLDSEFIRELVKEAKKEGVPVSICF